jgi:hypothetical protein
MEKFQVPYREVNPRLLALGFNQLSHRVLPIKTKKENGGICTRKKMPEECWCE